MSLVIATCVHFANHSEKRRGVIMTTTNQKINLNNCSYCTHEQIFKAISKIQAKAAATFIKDELRIGHHMKHMTTMAKHYVINSNDNFKTTRQGHPKSDNFLPSELGATRIIGNKRHTV